MRFYAQVHQCQWISAALSHCNSVKMVERALAEATPTAVYVAMAGWDRTVNKVCKICNDNTIQPYTVCVCVCVFICATYTFLHVKL